MNKKKLFFASFAVALALGGFFLFSSNTLAAIEIPSDYGLKDTAEKAELNVTDSVPTLVGRIIGAALSMLAVIFFILMIYAGFLWMTAHGNQDTVKKAQETMIAAIIGVIVVLGSYAITQFVFDSLESAPAPPAGGDAPSPQECIKQCKDDADPLACGVRCAHGEAPPAEEAGAPDDAEPEEEGANDCDLHPGICSLGDFCLLGQCVPDEDDGDQDPCIGLPEDECLANGSGCSYHRPHNFCVDGVLARNCNHQMRNCDRNCGNIDCRIQCTISFNECMGFE